MNQARTDTLLPFTVLDGMILIAGCAVTASIFRFASDGYALSDAIDSGRLEDWLALVSVSLCGLTVLAPILIGLQFARGRRTRPLPGEISWLIISTCYLPVLPEAFGWSPFSDRFWEWFNKWFAIALPILVIVCSIYATAWHFRTVEKKSWSHGFGLVITLLQSSVSLGEVAVSVFKI